MTILSDVGLTSFATMAEKCAGTVAHTAPAHFRLWAGHKPTCRRLISIALLLVLFLTACQPSTVISTLEAVVAAAEIALPVIGAAAGLPPQTTAGIVGYLQMVDLAITQASVILAGPGTSAQKSAQIAQAFAAIAAGCNCIPPGTPQTVVAVVNAVAQAVARFLSTMGAAPVAKGIAPSSSVPPNIKVTRTDRSELTKIRQRAEVNMAALKGVKK